MCFTDTLFTNFKLAVGVSLAFGATPPGFYVYFLEQLDWPQWHPGLCLAGLPAGRGIMSTSSTTIGWKRSAVWNACQLAIVFFFFFFFFRFVLTCLYVPPVCAGRLPHRAVHSAEHHHAGKAADPEQHLWNRHPVSGPCTVVCIAHYFWASWKDGATSCYLLALTHQTHLFTCPSCSRIKKKKKQPLLPFQNIPLSSVNTALIHVRRRCSFYMQIWTGQEATLFRTGVT